MCHPGAMLLSQLPEQAADPQARLLREKYGIAKPFADDSDDSDRPTPCSPATLAGMGADRD